MSGEIPRHIGNGECDRIAKAMAWLEWDGVQLYCVSSHVRRRIPPVAERKGIVVDAAA